MSHWRDLADRLDGKAPVGARRSSRWRHVRDDFLRDAVCECCGGRRYLVAHHIVPFHLAPDLELVHSNLIALCEAKRYGINCHLLLGHLGNFQRANPFVRAFAAEWNHLLIQSR